MKLAMVRLYCGDSGKKGFYNMQEVGLAKAFVKRGIEIYIVLLSNKIKQIIEEKEDSDLQPSGTERILLVDDEKATIDVVKVMLERLGYKVTIRTSSTDALEAFRNQPGNFDLVITDMTMPNMTGKDLAKEMMTIRSDIPIILSTVS